MKRPQKLLIGFILVFVFFITLYFVIVFSIWFGYENKIYPGVSVAGVSLSGLTKEEAERKILSEIDDFYKKNSYIVISGQKVSTKDLGLRFNTRETVEIAKNSVTNPFEIGKKVNLPLQFDFSQKFFLRFLKEKEEEIRRPVKNPAIKIKDSDVKIEKEDLGQRLIYGEATLLLIEGVGNLKNEFDLPITYLPPNYRSEEATDSVLKIKKQLTGGFEILYDGQKIKVNDGDFSGWIRFRKNQKPFALKQFELIFPSIEPEEYFSKDEIEKYLINISKRINREPINATLTIKDGKAIVFSLSRDGRKLKIEESTENILLALKKKSDSAEISVQKIKAEISSETLDDLGIKELIATGYSNFAGSPANRRHNIVVGASKFNGLLIKPGETFSFTKNLGEVDAANGYLPELVIKENTTTPEYGGGLCQVSSTAFRAALNSGLPIIARKAHSYPVSYYRPFGTDATIYVPSPDLKFVNDTKSYILIQTRIAGNYLYFDFYGTKKEVIIRFAGNKKATEAVFPVEIASPYLYDFGSRGPGSFKAIFYRFIYDKKNNLIENEYFYSNYDSPDKYPH